MVGSADGNLEGVAVTVGSSEVGKGDIASVGDTVLGAEEGDSDGTSVGDILGNSVGEILGVVVAGLLDGNYFRIDHKSKNEKMKYNVM